MGFKRSINIAKSVYDMLLGGLHSNNPPGIYEADEEYCLIDVDVASMYPNLIIKNEVKPEHLWDQFLPLYSGLVDTRMKAKRAGESVKAYALKIVANSVYGKMGSKDSWLHDNKSMYTVTINGQLMLLMLIEQCEEHGIEVFYANTDGITVKCPRDKRELFNSICKRWEEHTGFELEHAEYQKMVIRDVNNYAVKTDGGKFKEKGVFISSATRDYLPLELQLRAAFDKPVIANALHQYFFFDKPVAETIGSCTNILDFCMAQKVGGQFKVEYHHIVDGKLQIDPQQKTNRYYVSTTGGSLYKRKPEGITNLCAGKTVQILNDVEGEVDISQRKVDYSYYVAETNKIIQTIEVKQLTLF